MEIEQRLRKALLDLLDCDYWGEETRHTLTGHRWYWVVDPNDGTSDFLKGRKGSEISVGLLHDALPVLGIVYAPNTEDRGADCIAWTEGMGYLLRNGDAVIDRQDSFPAQLNGKSLKRSVVKRLYVSTPILPWSGAVRSVQLRTATALLFLRPSINSPKHTFKPSGSPLRNSIIIIYSVADDSLMPFRPIS